MERLEQAVSALAATGGREAGRGSALGGLQPGSYFPGPRSGIGPSRSARVGS